MQDEGELTNDTLKRLMRDSQLKKVGEGKTGSTGSEEGQNATVVYSVGEVFSVPSRGESAQYHAILPVHVIVMELDLNHCLDDPVRIRLWWKGCYHLGSHRILPLLVHYNFI